MVPTARLAAAALLALVAGCGGTSQDAADRGDYVLWHGATYVMSCLGTPDAVLGPAVTDARFDFVEGNDLKAGDFAVYQIRGVDPERALGLRGPLSLCPGEPEPGDLIATTGNAADSAALVEAAVEAAGPP